MIIHINYVESVFTMGLRLTIAEAPGQVPNLPFPKSDPATRTKEPLKWACAST